MGPWEIPELVLGAQKEGSSLPHPQPGAGSPGCRHGLELGVGSSTS